MTGRREAVRHDPLVGTLQKPKMPKLFSGWYERHQRLLDRLPGIQLYESARLVPAKVPAERQRHAAGRLPRENILAAPGANRCWPRPKGDEPLKARAEPLAVIRRFVPCETQGARYLRRPLTGRQHPHDVAIAHGLLGKELLQESDPFVLHGLLVRPRSCIGMKLRQGANHARHARRALERDRAVVEVLPQVRAKRVGIHEFPSQSVDARVAVEILQVLPGQRRERPALLGDHLRAALIQNRRKLIPTEHCTSGTESTSASTRSRCARV